MLKNQPQEKFVSVSKPFSFEKDCICFFKWISLNESQLLEDNSIQAAMSYVKNPT